jgi:hypothetical protein
MSLQQIGKMSLKNLIGTLTRVQFAYLDDKGDKQLSTQSGDITLGEVTTIDPGDLKVPDGSTVFMHVFVVWGTDNEASRGFIYQKGNFLVANYEITAQAPWPSNSLLENNLALIGIS